MIDEYDRRAQIAQDLFKAWLTKPDVSLGDACDEKRLTTIARTALLAADVFCKVLRERS